MNGKFTTYSGVEFMPEMLQINDINIQDIAHALARICRFNGHIKGYYSVAQHCIWVSDSLKKLGASAQTQMCGLLHDASEAYLGDIPTPIKKVLSDYVLLETQYQNTIFKHFNLSNNWEKMHLIIKEIDGDILKKEWKRFNRDCQEYEIDNIQNSFFDKIEKDYLNLYYLLCTQGD